MAVMAVFFTLGAVDRVIGNRFGLGAEFERAFSLMGPTALSSVGLIILAPVLADVLRPVLGPVFALVGADAGVFPGMLMSSEISYPLAAAMTESEDIARFSGLIVGAVLGAGISFSIPLACGLIKKEDQRYFSAGILAGWVLDPLACFIGGLAMGLPALTVLRCLVPVIIVCAAMAVGLALVPEVCMRLFRWFSRFLMAVISFGLVCGAVEAMTGLVIVPGLNPASEGFKTVGTIALSIGGSLPLLFVLRRLLEGPLGRLARRLKVNGAAVLSMMIGLTSIVPGYSSYGEMNGRGKVVFSALTSSALPMLGCHLGITAAVATEMVLPMLLAKCCSGVFAVVSAQLFAKKIFTPVELG